MEQNRPLRVIISGGGTGGHIFPAVSVSYTHLIKRPHGLLFESMITTRFWIVTILLAAITIITLKIR